MKLCPICHQCYEDLTEVCVQEGHDTLLVTRPRTRLIADKYRLDTLLARGGMGTIYVGTHLELDRPVAIKLLLPNFDGDGQALERFRREARATARVRHPNIIDIYDYGVLPEGEAYIVMELAQGESLHAHLKRVGKLSIAQALEIARQIAEGMDAAHRNDIVHRDLKPSNIILTNESEGNLRVKIVDFGIAKITRELSSEDAMLTAAGTMLGTPHYMSPEQCSGNAVDARSDIYSLGIMLYEMLAGRPPFEGDTPVALAMKHLHEPPPPITEQRSDVSSSLVKLIEAMLSTNPATRPQSAKEVAQRLVQLNASSGTSARRGEAGSPPLTEGVVTPMTPFGLNRHPTRALQPIVVKLDEETQVRQRRPSFRWVAVAIALTVGVIAIWTAVRYPHLTERTQTILPTPVPTTQVRIGQQPQASLKASPTGLPQAEKQPEKEQPIQAQQQVDKVENDEVLQDVSDVPVQARAEISDALGTWVEATNQGDIQKQMSFYHPHLDAFYLKRGVSRMDVQAEKKRLFDQASKIDVQAGEPQIKMSRDGRTAATRFRKRYAIQGADESRHGEVLQELRWVKTENGWKIVSERDVKVLR